MNAPVGKSERWFTAIPMRYSEDGNFWNRDAGLVALGLRELGIDARFVALGDSPAPPNHPLILCSLAQMEDPNWWKQFNLTGVILYAWAVAQYEPIARAIKNAGLKLILVLDNDGLVSPNISFPHYLSQRYYIEAENSRPKLVSAALALAKTLAAAIPARHSGRIRHLQHGDAYALPSPFAQEKFRKFLRWQRRDELIPRTHYAPYPVVPQMVCNPAVRKERVIIAVGRWQSVQKNTPLLVETLIRALAARPAWRAEVIGNGGEIVHRLLQKNRAIPKPPVNVVGLIPHEKLPSYYQHSQILLSTSFYESFHIAAGEALCCGCSVVGDSRISSMPYLTGANSGTLFHNLRPEITTAALLAEMDAWDAGQRDPAAISAAWTGRLHPKNVAVALLPLTESPAASK